MASQDKDIAALQTEVLHLALKARPGSKIRNVLCDAASWFPSVGSINPDAEEDYDGGIARQEAAELLRRINVAREDGGDPHQMLRSMRNAFEKILDFYDLEAE